MGRIIQLLNEEKLTNPFITQKKVPIGLKYPHEWYKERGIPIRMEDIITLPFSIHDQNAIIVEMQPGAGKTKLAMRIVYYLHLMGWRIVIYNPKGGEYLKCNEPIKPSRLLPGEVQYALPFEHWLPSFSTRALKKSELDDFRIFSPKLEDIYEPQELYTLGFTFAQASAILNVLNKNRKQITINLLYQAIDHSRRVQKASKYATLRHLENMMKNKFFDPDAENLNLTEAWQRGVIPVVSAYLQEVDANSYFFGKQGGAQFNDRTDYKKITICDDGHLFFPQGKDSSESVSIETMNNKILATGRSRGEDAMLLSQQPNLCNDRTLGLFHGYKILGKVSLGPMLGDLLSPEIRHVLGSLHYDVKNDIKEALLVHPDNFTYERFFPLGSPLGHPSNLLGGC